MESGFKKGNWNCLDVNNFNTRKKSKRRKYTRPCDRCAVSKVKCEGIVPCSRCVKRELECGIERFRYNRPDTSASGTSGGPSEKSGGTSGGTGEKSGGASGGTENCLVSPDPNGSGLGSGLGGLGPVIPASELLPFLQIYNLFYYGNWPVLPTNHLIHRLTKLNPTPQTPPTDENVLCYSLSCAVAGAIANQLTFLRAKNPINFNTKTLFTTQKPEKYIMESLRTRHLINYRVEPNIDNVLISFFYYLYYVNIKNGMSCGLMYMKEAVNFTQLLRLHDPSIYSSKPHWEIHTLTKFYYMLLISERYMSIEQNLPVSLQYSIPLPNLDHDDNPSLLLGFNELLKSFALPSREFFDTLVNYYSNSKAKLAGDSWKPSKAWIIQIHQNLNKIKIHYALGETQSMNVIVSKHWMRSLVWNISLQTNLLHSPLESTELEFLSISYPIPIATEFLKDVEGLSDFAFESNGPGLCVKLLEIANGVADSINLLNNLSHLPLLQTLFNLVSKYKNEITIPQNIYLKVQDIIIMKSSPRFDSPALMGMDLLIPSTVGSPLYENLVEINYFSLDDLALRPNEGRTDEVREQGVLTPP